MHVRALVLLATTAVLLLAAPSAHAAGATRTWVSGVGDDANPCSRTAPCKTFAGAISKTETGGEIDALDPGGFGAVTITKAITIDGGGMLAGVLVSGGTNGIVVNAPATDDVVLRNLDLQGSIFGAVAPCAWGSINGLRVLAARSVTVQGSSFVGFATSGISVAPTAATSVLVQHSTVGSVCGTGIDVAPAAGIGATVTLSDVTVNASGTGVRAADGAKLTIDGSTITGNGLGIQAVGTGTIDLSFASLVRGNTTNGTATSTYGQGPAGPQGATGPAGAVTAKLVVAASATRLRALRGRAVTIGYAATAKASATLEIRRAGRVVGRVRSTARAGANQVVWNGRIGRTAATAGTYVLTVRAAGSDGQVATDSVVVTVVARG